MTIVVEYDGARVSTVLKLRRILASPIYLIALIFSYVSDGLGDLAVFIARDPR